MSDTLTGESAGGLMRESRDDPRGRASFATRYGASLLFVAAATGFGFSLEPQIGAPNLTLVFVLPVLAAATLFGWGPSLLASVASVLAFDFFFTEPKFSFEIDSPTDIWSAILLLVIAAVVSAVGAQSRRRERVARRAADQAQALQALAHVVIHSGRQREIVAAAAAALNRIFQAPAVIFMPGVGGLRPVATAGAPRITAAEEEAAMGVMDTRLRMRAETYPFPASMFDFWPVETPESCRCVIGVGFIPSGRPRPETPDRFVEIVAAYLAAAFERGDDVVRLR